MEYLIAHAEKIAKNKQDKLRHQNLALLKQKCHPDVKYEQKI